MDENIQEKDITRLERARHSLAHVLAQAVLHLYPDAKLGIGPAIDNGFYYDFQFIKPIKEEDLTQIELEMHKIVSRDFPFVRTMQSKDYALLYFQKLNQPYKVEIINDIGDKSVSFYTDGDFTDLCRGPHVESTGVTGAFKLSHIAGAYWKGDERRPMLQRIYGIAFNTKEELESYLILREEIKKRDHRKLGKELELFMISDMVGPGLPLWLPNGAFIRRKIEEFEVNLLQKNGYKLVYTPHIGEEILYETSGHLEHYKKDMFPPMKLDGTKYYLRPMNCPHHIQIYKSKIRSYRDLPIRLAEMATIYRNEKSGELNGLARVRCINQDDGHVFVRPDQLKDEFKKTYKMIEEVLRSLGMDNLKVRLSLRDSDNKDKFINNNEMWEKAETALREGMQELDIDYNEVEGEAAFYGPKADFMFTDVFSREWQLSTLQIDFSMPERFNVVYTGEDGKEHIAVMIHRAILGSFERFMAMYIEHTGGAFPFWVSPVQMTLIPISQVFNGYAKRIEEELIDKGYRVEVDIRDEKMQSKIRDAQLKKIPYMIIIGAKEMESETISIRQRTGETLGIMKVDEFLKKIEGE